MAFTCPARRPVSIMSSGFLTKPICSKVRELNSLSGDNVLMASLRRSSKERLSSHYATILGNRSRHAFYGWTIPHYFKRYMIGWPRSSGAKYLHFEPSSRNRQSETLERRWLQRH